MTFIVADGIKETTTSATSPITLAGAEPGFKRFNTFMSVGDTTVVSMRDNANFETGLWQYTSANVLTRIEVYESTNNNNAVAWGGGQKFVVCGPLATDYVSANVDQDRTDAQKEQICENIGALNRNYFASRFRPQDYGALSSDDATVVQAALDAAAAYATANETEAVLEFTHKHPVSVGIFASNNWGNGSLRIIGEGSDAGLIGMQSFSSDFVFFLGGQGPTSSPATSTDTGDRLNALTVDNPGFFEEGDYVGIDIQSTTPLTSHTMTNRIWRKSGSVISFDHTLPFEIFPSDTTLVTKLGLKPKASMENVTIDGYVVTADGTITNGSQIMSVDTTGLSVGMAISPGYRNGPNVGLPAFAIIKSIDSPTQLTFWVSPSTDTPASASGTFTFSFGNSAGNDLRWLLRPRIHGVRTNNHVSFGPGHFHYYNYEGEYHDLYDDGSGSRGSGSSFNAVGITGADIRNWSAINSRGYAALVTWMCCNANGIRAINSLGRGFELYGASGNNINNIYDEGTWGTGFSIVYGCQNNRISNVKTLNVSDQAFWSNGLRNSNNTYIGISATASVSGIDYMILDDDFDCGFFAVDPQGVFYSVPPAGTYVQYTDGTDITY